MQNFVVVSWAYFKLEHSKFGLNFEFDRNTTSGMRAISLNPGSAGISGTRAPKTGCKMAATKLGNLLTKWPVWLSLYRNMFLGPEAKNKFGCDANNVIHLCAQMMSIFSWEIPSGFTPAICLCHNFVYISPLWRTRETNPSTKTAIILFWIVIPTWKSCHRPWLHSLKKQS